MLHSLQDISTDRISLNQLDDSSKRFLEACWEGGDLGRSLTWVPEPTLYHLPKGCRESFLPSPKSTVK